ncbi:hypothetical protein FGB62_27g24 [Gracilaria domingensis]|nr:hypothetical protein FGB62_27g24 [Gracilaria domingensis]
MSSYTRGSSGGDGRKPSRDKRDLGLGTRGPEKKKKRRTERRILSSQLSERIEEGTRSRASGAADPVRWLQATLDVATGVLPAGTPMPPAPEPIFSPGPDPIVELPPTPGAGPSAPLVPEARSTRAHAHTCPHCGQGSNSRRNIGDHVRRMHDRNNIRHCFYCTFSAPAEIFKNHMSLHSRRITCQTCEKKVAPAEFEQHIVTCKPQRTYRHHVFE